MPIQRRAWSTAVNSVKNLRSAVTHADDMAQMSGIHRLSPAELDSIAAGPGERSTIDVLRRAELSKHLLLVAAVAATARRKHAVDCDAIGFGAAFDLLVQIQAHTPQAVAEILALPQVGAWAIGCIDRMRADEDGGDTANDACPLWVDLGYLNTLAIAAALQAGVAFDLLAPVRRGKIFLPRFGVARIGEPYQADDRPWARIRVRSSGGRSVKRGPDRDPPIEIVAATEAARSIPAEWSRSLRVCTQAAGLVLDVILDNQDPFLDCYGHAFENRYDHAIETGLERITSGPGSGSTKPGILDASGEIPERSISSRDGAADSWRQALAQAWRLLAEHHYNYAVDIAAGLRTIVPLLRERADYRSGSVSCIAFGAIAVGLPSDTIQLAETLVHEFQHVKLGAVRDMTDLIGPGPSTLTYAPWRDDPRPPGALLHGLYAFLGVAGFWRTQRHHGQPEARLRGQIEFARWRSGTLRASENLAGSGCLSDTGECFVAGILGTLREWHTETVSPQALRMAEEVLAIHHLTWRAGHLFPDEEAVERLAAAWQRGPRQRGQPGHVNVRVSPRPGWPDQRSLLRTRMMELRYRDPSRFRRWQKDSVPHSRSAGSAGLDVADTLMVSGHTAAAAHEYRRRIEAADTDPGAWAGLALIAWRHSYRATRTSGTHRAAHRVAMPEPELACALHRCLRERFGQAESGLPDRMDDAAGPGHQDTKRGHGVNSAGPEWPQDLLNVGAIRARGARPVPFQMFVVKVHGRCNLACDYCYVYEMADQSWRHRPVRMSDDTLALTVTRIAEHARTHDLGGVRVVLHGGEPLLAGPALIARLATMLRATLPKLTPLRLSMQTNGVLLTRSILQMLADHDVSVGISMDGDRTATDRHRRYSNGRSSHSAVEQSLRLLRLERFRAIYGGILATIDLRNDPMSTYAYLLSHTPPRIDFLFPHGTS